MFRSFISFLIITCSFSEVVLSQPRANAKAEAHQLKKMLADKHILSKSINDSFSKDVFQLIIESLDPDHILFTQDDIAILEKYELKIDDELNGISWSFISSLQDVFKAALNRAEKQVNVITERRFEFLTNESIVEDTAWCKGEVELAERWRKRLKYEVLQRLTSLRVEYPEGKDADFVLKHEPSARARIQKSIVRQLHRSLHPQEGLEESLLSIYLNAVCQRFDPHSAYFNPIQFQRYSQVLNADGYQFGFSFEEQPNGQLRITDVEQGSAAWEAGLEPNDEIVKYRWQGKEVDWTALEEFTEEEFAIVLQASDKRYLELMIRKNSGLTKEVRMIKRKVELEESLVHGFVLEGGKKIGYIVLPAFYSDWNKEDGSRCANDVAKEIVKLRKENVEGIILDVRYNGGGSLQEAVALTGIFIDAGPVGILKDKVAGLVTVKDINRGTIYDGPLLVMVNEFSASASEFLAAALQDYNRAIVVGNETFGKATAQHLYSLTPGKPDIMISHSTRMPASYGFCSITKEQIYRITGKSIQQLGVKPHIVLPTLLDVSEFREHNYRYAMSRDSVVKKTYYQPLTELPIQSLTAKSDGRISQSAFYKLQHQIKVQLDELSRAPSSLLWSKSMENEAAVQRTLKLLNEAEGFKASAYQIRSTIFVGLTTAQGEKATDEGWRIKILQDMDLEQAFHILIDYLLINNHK